MLNYWVNFAKTGNPNDGQSEIWLQYSSLTDCYLEINSTPNGSQIGLRTAQSDLWDNVTGFTSCTGTLNEENISNDIILHVYPNPSNGIFKFNLSVDNDCEVEVFNSFGQRINVQFQANQFDIRTQSNGIYYFEIKTDKQVFKGKIIKNE